MNLTLQGPSQSATLALQNPAELTQESLKGAIDTAHGGALSPSDLNAAAKALFTSLQQNESFKAGQDVTLTQSGPASFSPMSALDAPASSGALGRSATGVGSVPNLPTEINSAPIPTATSLLKDSVPSGQKPELLSLALLDVDDMILTIPELASDYVKNFYTYTACHDVSAKLNVLLGDGDPTVAKNKEGVALAQEALGSESAVVHFRYVHPKGDGHSFTLVSNPGGVESLEGWAGADAEYAYPLHQCIFDNPRTGLALKDVQAAVANILNPDESVREAALDFLSRAGIGGFEDTYAFEEMELIITARPLDTQENIEAKLESGMDRAAALIKAGS